MNPADFIESLSASIATYPLVAVLVAIAGGAFSTTTCPCTIPAGVGIAGYVGSHEATAADTATTRWWQSSGFAVSIAFVAGLAVCLLIIGTLASVLGRLLTQWKVEFAFATAVLSGVAGVAVLMGPAIRMRVPDVNVRKRRGVAGAFVYGLFYCVATLTTSAGPLLLLITIAAAMGRPWYGAVLSLAYAIGRGIPFLMLGAAASASGKMLGRVERYRRPAEIVSGIALLALSIYFVRFALALR